MFLIYELAGGFTNKNFNYADPTKVIFKAVRGMLPVNKLRSGRLLRLKIYAGSEHNHSPQMPKEYVLKSTRKAEKEVK